MTQPKIKLKDYAKYGEVLDVPYGNEMVHYDVEHFINYICDTEIATSHAEYGLNYNDDPLYQKYKKIKDEQALTHQELIDLLDVYQYTLEKDLK